MITRLSLAFTLLCCPAISAADIFQPLNLKPGLWETTRTTEMSGQLPPEAMAKMPPEQRAKAEEMMKEYAKMFAKPVVSRDCMKKEDFDRPFKLDNLEKSCTKTVLSATSSKQEMRLQCTDGGVKQNVSFRLDVMNSESFKVSTHGTAGDGAGAMGMNFTLTGKWIGPACDSKDQKR
jgi:hypothetical protein